RRDLYCREAAVVLGHRRLVRRWCGRTVEDVDPVVRRVVGVGREHVAAAMGVDTVTATRSTGWSSKIAVGHGRGEVVSIDRIEAVGVVGGDVGGSGADRDWIGERDRLPAACRLIGKGGGREQRSGAGP